MRFLMRAFKNDTYDSLKWIGMIILPVVGILFFVAGKLFGLTIIQDVLLVILIVDLKVNSWVWWSTRRYYESDARFDGYIVLEEDPGGIKKMNLVVEGDPETLLMLKDEITFKVKRN